MSDRRTDGYPSNRQAGYILFCLLIAYIFSFIDRQILALLVTSIKASLGLSDFKLSLVQGMAFSVFFCLAALPVGRLVDRHDRRLMLIAAIALWSIATAVSGLAGGFASLFAARVFVGVGEAVISPAAYSIISDSFRPERVVRANAIYSAGSIIGTGIAFLFGGSVIALVKGMGDAPLGLEPWRLTFMAAGALGIIAIVLLLLAKEPPRRATPHREVPTFGETLAYLWGRRADYMPLYLSSVFLSMTAYSALLWYPTHMIRAYGVDPSQVGFIIGTIFLIAAPLGTFTSTMMVEYLQRRGHGDAPVRLILAAAIVIIPGTLCGLPSDLGVSLALFALMAFCQGSFGGNVAASIQFITPSTMRGMSGSMYMLVLTIGALGIGAALVGALSDGLFPGRSDGISLSMTIVAFGAALCAIVVARRALTRFRLALARTGGMPEA